MALDSSISPVMAGMPFLWGFLSMRGGGGVLVEEDSVGLGNYTGDASEQENSGDMDVHT